MWYFLRVNTEKQQWEEVDNYVFENRNKCLLGESPRYTGDYVVKHDDGKVEIHCETNTIDTMLVILRLAGTPKLLIETTMMQKDYCKKPEMIKFREHKNKMYVYENFSGTKKLPLIMPGVVSNSVSNNNNVSSNNNVSNNNPL